MVLAEAITDEIIARDYTELYTTGFPRSGNTWTGRLLADVLDSPWQEELGNPIRFYGLSQEGKYVIRKRHSCEQLPGPGVWVYRDPRDVCVSRHFYWQHPSMNHTILSMAGKLPDQKKPRPFETFVRPMLEHPEYYTIAIRYEDWHEKPVKTLWNVVNALTGLDIFETRILETIERQRFDAVLERFPDYEHSMRKGIIGDWENHFKRDDGRLFQEHFGKTMFEMGYIDDGDWWEELPV